MSPGRTTDIVAEVHRLIFWWSLAALVLVGLIILIVLVLIS